MRAEAAFLRFHLRVGARLAARTLAPVLAVIFIIFFILRPEFVLALARALFIEGTLIESGLAGTLLLLGLARAVVPRITAGRAGWARSLPPEGRALRAMEVLSSVVAGMPVLAVLAALAWFVAGPEPERIAIRLAALLVGAAAAGLFCLEGSSSLKGKILPAATEPLRTPGASDAKPENGPLRLFGGGNLIGAEGVALALRALAIARSNGVRFRYMVGGGGPELSRLQALARQLGMEQEVVFGSWSGEAYRDQLKAADLYLLPSLRDGAPVTLAEAMLAGCVPIVAHCGGPAPGDRCVWVPRAGFNGKQDDSGVGKSGVRCRGGTRGRCCGVCCPQGRLEEIGLGRYLRAGRPDRSGSTIAVVVASGQVMRGESGYSPVPLFGGDVMGSETLARAWRQVREPTGRRDDRYLLAALTDADWLTPWISVLHRERVPLCGITPLALACQHLLARLRLQEPHTLLAYRLNNRLRLSYYHNGLLRFSRLISSDTPTQLPGNAADEIANCKKEACCGNHKHA